jgi:RNA polymerase sigma factor (sigma-70 family)
MTQPRGTRVTPRLLQAVLRSFADIGPPVSDAELLRRFIQNDQQAFGELVRRHGRLVWAVCRNLTHSEADAEDAFQATFLVLLQNAKKIREAGKLSTWLYGVAHKVCANARRGAKRRNARQRVNAAPERNGAAIPESAWDRALAAVHEEAVKLPETLRLPFVLCCIEGKGVSDAAQQVGCKLGTFSSRLTRAKDAILAKLDERGLTLGVVAAVGLTSPPADAVAKAAAIAQSGFVVPSSILQLSQGVIGMSIKAVKMMVAAVVLTCGLGLGVGSSWVTQADAQAPAPKPPTTKAELEGQVQKLQAELEQLQLQEALRALKEQVQKEQPAFKTTKWEYDLVEISDMGTKKFAEFLQDRENRGWEYNGTTILHNGKPQTVWVFRRPAKVAKNTAINELASYYNHLSSGGVAGINPSIDLPKILEQYQKADLPLEPAEFASLIQKLAEKKFKPGRVSIVITGSGLAIVGDKDAISWADGLIKKLNEK